MFYIQANTPDNLIKEYHSMIGKPVLVPYWAFGYHQSRWGYKSQETLKQVVDNFTANNLPLDVLWTDIDYMDRYRDFTLNKNNYKSMPEFITNLNQKGIYFVPIIDAGISRTDDYYAYKDGLEKDLYIKSAKTKEPLVGIVWPGYAVFTDFTHPKTDDFWISHLEKLHVDVPFNGIWLDMNEPANFCDGECPDELHYVDKEYSTDSGDMIPYYFGHSQLRDMTLSMDAKHYNNKTEYYFHSLYGFYMTRAVNKYFKKVGKRPFIISRSTYPGTGRYGSHWLGDNYSKKEYMEYSIAGIYNFQMFGIPLVGPDVCGFTGNANILLCKRWMQLGAFYPFYRNHHEIDSGVQEPYVTSELAKVSANAIKTRYRLFRYIYSEYFTTALYGGVFFKPLFWKYSTDTESYNHNEETFLLGPNLKISPCLDPDSVENINSYFPNDDWYEIFTGEKILSYSSEKTEGSTKSLSCAYEPDPILNVHISGGSIVPIASRAGGNLKYTLNEHIELIITPKSKQASGKIFYDDEKNDTIVSGNYQSIAITLNENNINFESLKDNFDYIYGDITLTSIKIYGANDYAEIKCANITTINTSQNVVPIYNTTQVILHINHQVRIDLLKSIALHTDPCP